MGPAKPGATHTAAFCADTPGAELASHVGWPSNTTKRSEGMDVRSLVARWLPFGRQDDFLVVQAESPTTLTLRQGRLLTAFDRLSRTTTQQGKVVAAFGNIRHVRVFEEPTPSRAAVWCIALQLAGTRSVRLGCCAEQGRAAELARQVSAVTGASVVAGAPTLM